MLRLSLLVLGLLTLVGLVWHIGPGRIVGTITALGPLTLVLILLPSLLMYVIEAYGWRVTLIRHAGAVSFGKLLAIRTAGEVVNMTTPTAYMGGEPLKAFLLSRYQVPMVDGLASVVIAKTIMSLAEVLFILLGIGLGLWLLGGAGSGSQTLAAAVIGVGLLLCGILAFVLVQRRGLFTWMLETLRRLGLRIGYLESREDGALDGLSVFYEGGTCFILGSLGAREGDNLLLFAAFGYSEVTGITFALLRRVRELVWIGIGLVCLGSLGGTPIQRAGESAPPPPQ
ncbi:MAG: flippase-like domain-containing protein [Nitrospirae bacterium]|nr:flippase-like domain-containing protein [Nitrospirota bacterium]